MGGKQQTELYKVFGFEGTGEDIVQILRRGHSEFPQWVNIEICIIQHMGK